MNYATSRHTRHIVGRLTRGEKLIPTLERICRKEKIRAGSFQAVGILSSVQLQVYKAPTGYEPLLEATENVELLSLRGNVSTLADAIVLNCYAQVAIAHLGQCHVFGGQIADATALSVEFTITAFDDLVMERRLEPKLGLPMLNRVETVAGDSTTEHLSASPSEAAPRHEPTAARPEPKKEEPTAPRPEPAPAPRPEPEPEPEPDPDLDLEAEPEPAPTRAAAFSSDGTAAPLSEPTVTRLPARPAEPKKEEPKLSWGDAMRASEQAQTRQKLNVIEPPAPARAAAPKEDPDTPDTPDIQVGDALRHPHFGECKVLLVEEDEYVKVRLRGGKVIDIKLEVCVLTFIETKGSQNVFNCEIVRR
jgi:predicted DNA-binding protein with PD1-like motif